jgi:hypothetical protein
MTQIGFGIVGTGMIAGVVADAITKSANARLAAVSSRRIESAVRFTAERPGVEAVQGIDSLLARPEVGAVYIATPTVAKEEIALAAIGAGNWMRSGSRQVPDLPRFGGSGLTLGNRESRGRSDHRSQRNVTRRLLKSLDPPAR